MTVVRHGICVGGPNDRQTLATMQPGVVSHPNDAGGFYVFKTAVGADPAKWLWIKKEVKK